MYLFTPRRVQQQQPYHITFISLSEMEERFVLCGHTYQYNALHLWMDLYSGTKRRENTLQVYSIELKSFYYATINTGRGIQIKKRVDLHFY